MYLIKSNAKKLSTPARNATRSVAGGAHHFDTIFTALSCNVFIHLL
ncbi:MAG: hypothetical protein UR99_C0009G0003 [Candidatus Moranbacteria bacterium GW2011_GWD2_36_12]|nr:MAG: hypothetical protein UR99_C0009G0003 [Candidatus Moranbacteria bacterium GW2011_GWD2_36_12]KKQ06776.1 MAG: hypothetical protein US16_C0009G0003 [Candidatus Moranbacteria bacterium GW2011_GWE2_36_40]